ncbi:MAG: adenylyl-sulfate kinase [Magnetococcales bacterium]|nr:adenylyl-sulfate kinase [Magnetococcales bacterium]
MEPAATCSSDTVWHPHAVTRVERERLNGHRGMVIWFTGLSGSGKSTLAQAVGQRLHEEGRRIYVLDGDNIRHGLCADLGFSDMDRQENIRRIGEVARLMVDAGLIVLTAFISPFTADRQRARNLISPGDFIEVYCDASLAVCEQRDVKGLYRKARAGLIREFTGISSPYEPPSNPEIAVPSGLESVGACVARVLAAVNPRIDPA